jgi:CHAT domain-containing protein/tetratricopeptide (TPR) repeat protein
MLITRAHKPSTGPGTGRPETNRPSCRRGRRTLSVLAIASLFLLLGFSGDSRGQSWVDNLKLAKSLYRAGDIDSAIAIGELTLEMVEGDPAAHDTTVARVLATLGVLHYLGADYPVSDSLCRRALTIMQPALGECDLRVAEIQNSLANTLLYRSKYAAAAELYNRVLTTREEILGPDHPDVAKAAANIALTYERQGKYAEAEPLYERAIPIMERALGPDHPHTRLARNNLAVLYQDQGKLTAAKSLYEKALVTLEKASGAERRVFAGTLHNLAMIAKAQGDYEEAEDLYKRGLAAREEYMGPEHPDVAESLNSLIQLYIWQRRLDEAEQLVPRQQAIWSKVYGPDHPAPATSMHTLALLHQRRGRYSEAEELYEHALAIWEAVYGSNHRSVAKGLESYSGLLRLMNEHDKAIELAGRACAMQRKILLDNYTVMSERDALESAQSLRNSTDNFLTCFLGLDSCDKQSVETATNIVVSTKGQVSDGIFERQQALAVETDSTTQALAEALTYARFQLSKLFLGRPEWYAEDFTEKTDSLGRLAADLETQLSRRSSSFRSRQESRHVTADLIRSVLPDKSVLLEYQKYHYIRLEPDTVIPGYLVIVMGSDGTLDIHDLGEAGHIDTIINEYRQHMLGISLRPHMPLQEDRQAYETIARKLYGAVLRPVETCLSDRELVLISPDGGLNLVSFSGLVDGDGMYLIERFPLHYLSAGRELIRLEERTASGRGLIAFGDPDYDAGAVIRNEPFAASQQSTTTVAAVTDTHRSGQEYFNGQDLTALPGTRAEVQAVADNWRASCDEPVVLCFGMRASEDVFKAEGPGNRIIHLATHGYCMSGQSETESQSPIGGIYDGYFGKNPLFKSGLFFAGANLRGRGTGIIGAEDGVLTAYEVSAMDLHGTDMVVLSACETGLGKVQQGEGVYGLRRAFQMAGVRTVISSLWPVPDRETAAIMMELYAVSDEALPERLRRIQLARIAELRASQLADHPYTWAAFIALGDWR